jgi:hypothetical protein
MFKVSFSERELQICRSQPEDITYADASTLTYPRLTHQLWKRNIDKPS